MSHRRTLVLAETCVKQWHVSRFRFRPMRGCPLDDIQRVRQPTVDLCSLQPSRSASAPLRVRVGAETARRERRRRRSRCPSPLPSPPRSVDWLSTGRRGAGVRTGCRFSPGGTSDLLSANCELRLRHVSDPRSAGSGCGYDETGNTHGDS